MRVIKRNGAEVEFDIVKIIAAVTKANDVVDEEARMTPVQIQRIAESVEFSCQSLGRAPTVEEIQDFVEHQIMAHGAFEVAKRYITYRYNRSLVRKSNTTDDKILSLIECNNEEAKQENSNKNPVVNSTQRDYMAGEVSRDLTNRLLLPEDIVKAHEEGIIHFHDTDYYAQHMHNCDLVNLEDMLQNGTVITGTLIERPHSFATACNIATQIIAQVASNQYGGQSISLTHLAPFVQVSRERIRREVAAEMQAIDAHPGEEKLAELTEAYNNVAVPYNEIANLVNENGWMADEQTNAEMNAMNSTLGTVGTALTEDISMLDGVDVDALIAALSDELPGALAELKDRVSVPYEG